MTVIKSFSDFLNEDLEEIKNQIIKKIDDKDKSIKKEENNKEKTEIKTEEPTNKEDMSKKIEEIETKKKDIENELETINKNMDDVKDKNKEEVLKTLADDIANLKIKIAEFDKSLKTKK